MAWQRNKSQISWEIEQELNEYELKDSDIEYLLSLER